MTESRPLRVLVDMDAVIADWHAEYDRQLALVGDPAAAIPRSHQQPSWNLKLDRTPAEIAIIDELMAIDGFYRDLEQITGAHEALNGMLAAGHDVRIVSAPFIPNATCASDKLAWVARHYGPEWVARVILTNDKTFVRGDILIDDKPEIIGACTPDWGHIVFGSYPYNSHIDGHRMRTWADLPQVLDRIGFAA